MQLFTIERSGFIGDEDGHVLRSPITEAHARHFEDFCFILCVIYSKQRVTECSYWHPERKFIS